MMRTLHICTVLYITPQGPKLPSFEFLSFRLCPAACFVRVCDAQPPFIQKTIKHGDMPIWLHANCMLYAPGCSVQHHHPEASPEVEGGGSGKSSSTATPSKGSSSKSTGSAGQEAGSGRGAGKSKSKGSHADGDGKKEDGEGLPQAVYFGVDEARKRVALKCTSCGLQGAVIGCHASSCQVNTHYACALKEGWEFGEPNVNGKVCVQGGGWIVIGVWRVAYVECLCVCINP